MDYNNQITQVIETFPQEERLFVRLELAQMEVGSKIDIDVNFWSDSHTKDLKFTFGSTEYTKAIETCNKIAKRLLKDSVILEVYYMYFDFKFKHISALLVSALKEAIELMKNKADDWDYRTDILVNYQDKHNPQENRIYGFRNSFGEFDVSRVDYVNNLLELNTQKTHENIKRHFKRALEIVKELETHFFNDEQYEVSLISICNFLEANGNTQDSVMHIKSYMMFNGTFIFKTPLKTFKRMYNYKPLLDFFEEIYKDKFFFKFGLIHFNVSDCLEVIDKENFLNQLLANTPSEYLKYDKKNKMFYGII